MDKLYKIKESLCEQLESYADDELTASSLEIIDKLAHAAKNIDKVIEAYDKEYSSRNDRRRYEYDDMSNARGRGRNAKRDSMGRYSREGYYREGRYSMDSNEMVENLREMMQEAPDEKTRQIMERTIKQLEQM